MHVWLINFVNVFLLFPYYLPLGRVTSLHSLDFSDQVTLNDSILINDEEKMLDFVMETAAGKDERCSHDDCCGG